MHDETFDDGLFHDETFDDVPFGDVPFGSEVGDPPVPDPLAEARDELRWGPVHGLCTHNQEIIEDAYLVSDFLGWLAADGGGTGGLFFEQANCYNACFHRVKEWLELVDPQYLRLHPKVVAFFARDNWHSPPV